MCPLAVVAGGYTKSALLYGCNQLLLNFCKIFERIDETGDESLQEFLRRAGLLPGVASRCWHRVNGVLRYALNIAAVILATIKTALVMGQRQLHLF